MDWAFRQLQDEMRNISILGFGAPYIRDLMVPGKMVFLLRWQGFCWPNFVTGHTDLSVPKAYNIDINIIVLASQPCTRVLHGQLS